MTAPSLSTCSPWASVDDLCNPCLSNYDSLDSQLIERTLQIASDVLYVLSGRQFPGTCSATVRPCSSRVWSNPPSRSYSSAPASFGCGCSSRSRCGCPAPSEITLGVYPIVSIEQVRVDGIILTPVTDYRVDDHRTLVRLSPNNTESWPCCPNILLPDTEPDTFSVSFSYGHSPPLAGIHAAAVLACELYLACNPIDGAECRLPKRVQSITRQGISMVMIDPMEFLAAGRLGITEVDSFLTTYNPNNLRRNSGVYSPDIGPRFRRVSSTTGGDAGFGESGDGYGYGN